MRCAPPPIAAGNSATRWRPRSESGSTTIINVFYSLFTTALDLVICAFILRIVLQLVQANFYNPISQLIWKFTQPVTLPLTRAIPRYRNVDLAAVLILVVFGAVDILIVGSLYGYGVDLLSASWLGLLKIASLGLRIYLLSLLIVTILSWVGPGLSNPAANVLWSITEPVLQPVRRLLPTVAGLDLSPIPVMIVFQAFDKLLQTQLGIFY